MSAYMIVSALRKPLGWSAGIAVFTMLVGISGINAQTDDSLATRPRSQEVQILAARQSSYSRDLGEAGQIVIDRLDLPGTPLGSVVRGLAKLAKLNIIGGDNLQGNVNLYWENVTVQDALTNILRANGYSYIYDGNIVRIDRAEVFDDAGPERVSAIFQLRYLSSCSMASTLAAVFGGSGSSSTIQSNVEANSIVVVDVPDRVDRVRRLIEALDRRHAQVAIDGKIMELTYNKHAEWGVNWNFFQNEKNQLSIGLAPREPHAAMGQFTFHLVEDFGSLQGFIQAMESNGDVKVLANPRVMVLDNESAEISLIDRIPTLESSVSMGVITETIKYERTGIELNVTPRITDDGFIRMKIDLIQRVPGEEKNLGNSTAIAINERRARTNLIVPNETTVVIGGLRSSTRLYSENKIPMLGNLPIINHMFKSGNSRSNRTELLLFLSPAVVKDLLPAVGELRQLADEFERVPAEARTRADYRWTNVDYYEAVDQGMQRGSGIHFPGRNKGMQWGSDWPTREEDLMYAPPMVPTGGPSPVFVPAAGDRMLEVPLEERTYEIYTPPLEQWEEYLPEEYPDQVSSALEPEQGAPSDGSKQGVMMMGEEALVFSPSFGESAQVGDMRSSCDFMQLQHPSTCHEDWSSLPDLKYDQQATQESVPIEAFSVEPARMAPVQGMAPVLAKPIESHDDF